MKWKFKENDIIIWPADDEWNIPLIARVDNRREEDRHTEYHLLFLDSSSVWAAAYYIERDYEKLNWNPKFFDLFMTNYEKSL